MLSHDRPHSTSENSVPSTRILESRSEYRSCHIHVPDQDTRLAAVSFNKNYYSFFRVVKNDQQAFELCRRLANRGDATVITKTVKGYAVWVLEPEALVSDPSKTTQPQIPLQQISATCRVLESRNHYQPCHVRVPDLDKRLAAVQVGGRYYSLLKVAKDQEHAVEVAARLIHRGNEAIVIKNTRGCTIWVLEPEAIPTF